MATNLNTKGEYLTTNFNQPEYLKEAGEYCEQHGDGKVLLYAGDIPSKDIISHLKQVSPCEIHITFHEIASKTASAPVYDAIARNSSKITKIRYEIYTDIPPWHIKFLTDAITRSQIKELDFYRSRLSADVFIEILKSSLSHSSKLETIDIGYTPALGVLFSEEVLDIMKNNEFKIKTIAANGIIINKEIREQLKKIEFQDYGYFSARRIHRF